MIKRKLSYFILIFLSFISAILILELLFKVEYYYKINKNSDLPNFMISPRIYNSNYGWELKKNFNYSYITSDNEIIKKKTNNLGLASEYDLQISKDSFKILVIGDSFTESLGVDTEKAWPNQLQKILIENSYSNVEVYNGAIAGYNLDQYYFRIEDLYKKINPNIILIGFATATDFYDVGKFYKYFVYGSNIGRNYFEMKNGQLTINKKLNSIKNIDEIDKNISVEKNLNLLVVLKNLLEYSELYKKFKKSAIVVRIATKLRNDNFSLWPSTEMGITKKNKSIEKEKFLLINEILNKISNEYGYQNNLFLVHIPYKIEVDNKFWAATFANQPEYYDQNGPEKRIKNILKEKKIEFIPLVNKFKEKINKNQEYLYLKNDGHLNSLGNYYVSETIFENIKDLLPVKN